MCLIQCIQPYHLASRRAARHFETKSLQEILFSGRANLSKWKLNILFVPGIGRNILRLGGEKYFDISKLLEFLRILFTNLKFRIMSARIIQKKQLILNLIFRLAEKSFTASRIGRILTFPRMKRRQGLICVTAIQKLAKNLFPMWLSPRSAWTELFLLSFALLMPKMN